MDHVDSPQMPNAGKQSPAGQASNAGSGVGAAEGADSISASAEKFGDLAGEAIRNNPLAASLTVFVVGLVTGAILGILLSRD